MTNSIQLRDVIEADLPIFFKQQQDPDAIEMAAFLHAFTISNFIFLSSRPIFLMN
jgi:hypothetical protein